MRGELIGVVYFLLSSSTSYCSMDVCDAATAQAITGLLNPDCRDFLIMDWRSDLCCTILVCVCPLVQKVFRCAVISLTFLHHADTQTLLEAAVLAAVASPLVHRTVLTGQAHILGVFLHGALGREETGIPIISLQTQSTT